MAVLYAFSSRLTSCSEFINVAVSPYPRSRARIRKYRVSSRELSARLRNRLFSVGLRRRNPSAILAGTDTILRSGEFAETSRRSPPSGTQW